MTLSVGAGIINVSGGNSGISGGDIVGNNSSSVSLTGTLAEINSLLSGGSTGTINFNANSDSPPSSTQLTLHVSDNGNTGGGALTDDAFVTINIAAVNDAPTTSNTNAVGNEDAASIQINLSGNDIDGSVSQFKITSLPTNGKLYADAGLTNEISVNELVGAVANAASVFFVPDANFNGGQSFQFAAVDNLGLADASPATANITVNAVADPTITVANHIYTDTTSPITVQAAWLLRDDSDADGPLSVTSVDESSAKFAINDAGLPTSFTVDFDNGQTNGSSDPFTYTVTGGTVVNGGAVHLDTSGAIDGVSTNDIIVGTGAAETLNGNDGNDVLSGGGGNDTLNGGNGDDWLIYDTADGTINGGANFDTLRVESGTLDFNIDDDTGGNSFNFLGRVNNIEAIDLRNGNTANDIGDGSGDNDLSAADVIDITDANKTLYIMGDGNGAAPGGDDQVRLSGTWTVGATAQVNDPAHADINGLTFTQYTLGGATVYVQDTVEVINNAGG